MKSVDPSLTPGRSASVYSSKMISCEPASVIFLNILVIFSPKIKSPLKTISKSLSLSKSPISNDGENI